ncbi:MAG: NAD-dependent epimerase/dehydratase family protein, partial [Gammaproteobacteria bacterium]
MMPVPVALTGATGFIGNALLKSLRYRGHPVRALTRRLRANEPGVAWVLGDLHRKEALLTLVKGAGAVVHCAGAIRGAGPEHFHRINVEGTENLA